jgi:hypothetical protein
MPSGTLSLILTGSPSSGGGEEELSRLIQRLFSAVNTWVRSQRAKVYEAYLVPEADGLMLYVIGRQEAYDFDLSRELSDFAGHSTDQGLELNTTLLPASSPEELGAFFDPLRGPAIRIPAE